MVMPSCWLGDFCHDYLVFPKEHLASSNDELMAQHLNYKVDMHPNYFYNQLNVCFVKYIMKKI